MSNKLQYTLALIGQKLNHAGVLWGVGASVLLHQYSLIDHPSDIDILVATQDIHQVDSILSQLGDKKPDRGSSPVYATDFFYEYTIHGVDVDVIAGFNIINSAGIFKYPFDALAVPHHFTIQEVAIPFTTLEDWYILYQLMPDRESKVDLIEAYFEKNGFTHGTLLQRHAHKQQLPDTVKCKMNAAIKSCGG